MPGSQSTHPRLPAERLRASFSPSPGTPALLQRTVPASRAAVVTMEGSAELPGDGGGPRKTQRAKPALPRARQTPAKTSATKRRSGSSEGNHQRFFSITVAIALAAMRDSPTSSGRHSGASVPAPAGAPWNVFGNGSGAGSRCARAVDIGAGSGATDNPDILIA